MKEPTEAQVKEFWEWCGFKRLPEGKKGWHYERTVKVMNWLAPDQTEYFMSLPYLPRIDLNSLFKYAVPKVGKWELGLLPNGKVYATVLGEGQQILHKAYDNDPALALFWALKEVQLLNSTNNT